MKTLKSMILFILIVITTSCVQDSPRKLITVSVNMNTENMHDQVGVRGTFPLSWEETTFLSDDNGDGIYEGEFEIYTASNSIEFKFVNQNDQFELNGQDNRVLEFEYKPETITIQAIFNNPDTKITKH